MKETPTRRRYNYLNFDAMQKAGFNLKAFSVMMCEDTFYFETLDEAEDAWKYFENGAEATGEYVGYWYSIEEIKDNIEYYKEEFEGEPEIIYINDK